MVYLYYKTNKISASVFSVNAIFVLEDKNCVWFFHLLIKAFKKAGSLFYSLEYFYYAIRYW
jgi:hypothetical protein